MITSLVLSLIAIASGALLTYLYDDAPLASRLCTGACVGFALMGLTGFILALCFGLNGPTIAMTALLLCLPIALLTQTAIRGQINADIDSALKTISRATVKRSEEHTSELQ